MSIPARALHVRYATGSSDGVICSTPTCAREPKTKKLVLHHDHLANFARKVLFDKWSELYSDKLERNRVHSHVWSQTALELFDTKNYIRFHAAFICENCNNGDGPGKNRNFGAQRKEIYPSSFSMSPVELRKVQDARPKWECAARDIWERNKVDHQIRRHNIEQWASALVRTTTRSAKLFVAR